jgi:hypothetical protein
MNLMRRLFSLDEASKLRITKSVLDRQWAVKQGNNTLYIGSKGMCKAYIKIQAA